MLWLSPRAAATRGTWYRVAAIVMSGSSPDPELVTRSTGTGPGGALGFSFFNSATRCCTVWTSVLLVGPRFEAVEFSALYGCALLPSSDRVAEGRPWKYLAEVQYCPIRSEPTSLPLT